ncbi:MAG: glycosyltransferase family 4 protein [Clostridiales bacterium]|nr:glycosyltransferase family 4 protein [Clostridiales bacterium]
MKIIIFGIGKIYNKVKCYFYGEDTEVVALVDNNREIFGTLMDGYVVDIPEHIEQYHYDCIVIASSYVIDIRQQLLIMGIQSEKIVHYKDYIGSLPVKVPNIQMAELAKNVLIMSNDFGYHGGAITCMILAYVLRQEGYMITIVVPSAERKLLDEISIEEGIKVVVVDYLEFMSMENLEWTSGYTYVFANTIVMLRCAIKLAQKRKVYLWIHDSIDSYVPYEYWYDEIVNGIKSNQLIIGAVSGVARNNFQSIFQTEKKIELLPFGIGDSYKGNKLCVENATITFMVAAGHNVLKGIDVLLDALVYISEKATSRCRFLFAGKAYDTEYGKRIRDRIDKNANCQYLGELSRKNLFEVYSEADIVIVPSRRETLSLVATEAMMLEKPCIVSDAIGMAAYIRHQYNGLVFKSEDSEGLAKVICWCLENKEKLISIAEKARETYEQWFTKEKFTNRIKDVCELL